MTATLSPSGPALRREAGRPSNPPPPSSLPPFEPLVVPPWRVRLAKIAKATSILARDPSRLDQVLVFILNVNYGRVARLVAQAAPDAEARRILEEQPRIDRKHVDFEALARLPDRTLGREYTRFLKSNGITPDAFESAPDIGNERVAYVLLRMRQTHDLWHVLTGYEADVRGELLLQAFTYGQLGAPASALIAIFGSLRYARQLPHHARDLRVAYTRGKATRTLATVRWEDDWATPLEVLRARLACPPA